MAVSSQIDGTIKIKIVARHSMQRKGCFLICTYTTLRLSYERYLSIKYHYFPSLPPQKRLQTLYVIFIVPRGMDEKLQTLQNG